MMIPNVPGVWGKSSGKCSNTIGRERMRVERARAISQPAVLAAVGGGSVSIEFGIRLASGASLQIFFGPIA